MFRERPRLLLLRFCFSWGLSWFQIRSLEGRETMVRRGLVGIVSGSKKRRAPDSEPSGVERTLRLESERHETAVDLEQ